MKRDDHLALAAYLVGLCPERWRDRGMRTAFYAGAVLPDSNPATYLRGVTRAHKPAGHNTQWSYATVLRLLAGVRRNGVRGMRQAYRLGALTHYLADAFTYPHMPSFPGGIPAHNRYEREMHRVFGEVLGAADRNGLTDGKKNDIMLKDCESGQNFLSVPIFERSLSWVNISAPMGFAEKRGLR